MRTLPAKDQLTICFAHVVYRMAERFALRNTGIGYFEVRTLDELTSRLGEFDLLCVSMLWRNEFIQRAPRLAFIQSISAGTDQYSRDELGAAGIRVASAQGANELAVAEHAIALILAMARQIPQARDNQSAKTWRGMIGDISKREDELGGKTLLVVGLGQIGGRLAQIAKAFDMRVVGLRRNPAAGRGAADAVYPMGEFGRLAQEADFIALTCPLTDETENLVDAATLSRMKPAAHLVNIARGRVVDETALVEALAARRIAGAGIDVTVEEPLAPNSPLWGMEQVLITPHTAGETRAYEDNVIEILRDNLERLRRGETQLRNQVV